MSARVLVVDDVLPNVKLLEAKLTHEYFEVITASNGPEALERAAFFQHYSNPLSVPGTSYSISYDPVPRLAIATSKRDASESISLGAYAFALMEIELK